MKLIKTLDSRLESATAKPGQTKRFGLFECPVCKEHVEKPLTKGKRNKTCGKQECRKAALQYNYEGNYQFAADAARIVPGVTAGKIPAVCKGTRKSHAGFKWAYTE